MTYTIAGVFRPDLGSSADGLTVQGYAVSSWSGSPPALGTTPPGSPAVSAVTSTSFGDHGAWGLPLPTNEDYFVVVEYSSDYYWQRCNAPAWTDGSSGELDVSSATIAGVSAYGLDNSELSADVLTVGTDNVNSSSSGSIGLGAFVDHIHAGLGASLGIVPGMPPAATRYVGATTGGAPGAGSYQPGDFAIDQTGEIWIYTSSSEWVAITPASPSGVTGSLLA